MKNFNPYVVGFCGGKGNGKDTAAKVLIKHYGFQRVSFADGLKLAVATALRIDVAKLEDPDFKESIHGPSGEKYRTWLQLAGTEWFRSLWEDIWIEWWRGEINEKKLLRVVTTDMRFPNELLAVRGFQDSITLRVTNPRLPPATDKHASEAHFSSMQVDADITNDKDISTLELRTITEVFKLRPDWLDSRRTAIKEDGGFVL